MSYVLQEKHCYVGIDANEEMIKKARETISNTNAKFLVGNITKKKSLKKLEPTFDTLTFLGNSFCHFSTNQFLNLIKGVETVVHKGTYFLLEYRDVVKMLYNNEWKEKLTIKRGKKEVRIRTTNCDTAKGSLLKKL